MPLNCTLKMFKMVNFIFCVLCHNCFFKVWKEGRKGRRGKGKREKEKNYRWTVSKWDWKWCNFFASQAHPIWKPPPLPLPGNISLLLKNSPNPVPCPTWCWLSPFSFPVTNPDPIHHSRTPVLSNLRCTASRPGWHPMWGQQVPENSLLQEEVKEPVGTLCRGSQRRAPGLPSQRHSRDTHVLQAERRTGCGVSLLLPTSLPSLTRRRQAGNEGVSPSALPLAKSQQTCSAGSSHLLMHVFRTQLLRVYTSRIIMYFWWMGLLL